MNRSRPTKRNKPKVQGGMKVSNSLSDTSTTSINSSSPVRPIPNRSVYNSSPIRPLSQPPARIGSDEGLVLGRARRLYPSKTRTAYPSSKNTLEARELYNMNQTSSRGQAKFTKNKVSNPVVKYTFGNGAVLDESSSSSDEGGGAFSDAEANEVVIKRAYGGEKKNQKKKKNNNGGDKKGKVLEIADFYTSVNPLEYSLVRFPCEKVVFGMTKETVTNTGNSLRLVYSTDLSYLEIQQDNEGGFGKGEVLIHVDFERDVSAIGISDEGVVFTFDRSVKGSTGYFDRVGVFGSAENMRRFKTIWKLIGGNDRYKTTAYSNVDLNRSLKSDNINGLGKLGKKNFASLNKRSVIRGSAIAKPATPVKKDNDIITPTDPASFYSNARVTRSLTKTAPFDINDHITIEDSVIKKRKQPKIHFKPSLQYKFKDNSVMRIKNVDFRCLYGSEWINDTLIDFFVKYLTETTTMTPLFELKKEDITIISSLSDPVDETHIVKPEQIQVLSTFFFNKLKSTPNYYDNIKKWVSKLPLSSKQFIILPINESLHWYCTIIHNLSHLLTTPNNEGRCTIYSFDSLGQSHEDILTPLRAFIKGYAKDHHGLDITDDQVKLQIGKVPKQPNFNDCGIHVIYNVMKFITHEEEIVKFWDRASKVASQKVSSSNALAVGVKKDMNRLFLNSERVKMREKLRELLLRLQKEQIERGDVVTDVEDAEDEDEEDIVYIDAAEFNRKKLEDAAKRCEPKDNSDESKNASGRASNEGSVDAEEKVDIDGMEDDNEVERKDVEEETNPNHQEAQDINIDDEETRRDYVDELSQALSRITETAASLQESQSNETQSKVTDPSSQDIELVGVEVYESSSLPVSAQPRSQPTESSQPVQNQEIQSSLEALNDPTEMEMEDDSSSGTVRKYECINLDEDDSNDRKKSKL